MSESTACPSRIFSHRFASVAYDYIWKKLFCAKTGLFYDRISPDDDRFSHLPSVEEIAKQFPNPSGWGTGMEPGFPSTHNEECHCGGMTSNAS